MHVTAKLPRKLNIREQRAWPRPLSGDSTSRFDWQHRQAISPSAAGEPAGMLTTHTPSPLGLPVLFGSQRATALRQSATHHRQMGHLPCGSRRASGAARKNPQHLANSLEFFGSQRMRKTGWFTLGMASLCSPPSPSLTCLTVGSTGTPNHRLRRVCQAGAR
jgi:hypothetical protein